MRGTWDPMDGENYGLDWARVELRSCDLRPDGVSKIYETLFGPSPELNSITDDKKIEEAIQAKRQGLVWAVRVLLATVGINYKISTKDGTQDQQPGDRGDIEWILEGNGDKWFARETREACGFQLTRDPKEKKKGMEEREYLRKPAAKVGYTDNEEEDDEYDSDDSDYLSDY